VLILEIGMEPGRPIGSTGALVKGLDVDAEHFAE